jgi:hypothetical protein
MKKRNVVAKAARVLGLAPVPFHRDRKNDYQRKPKHRNR